MSINIVSYEGKGIMEFLDELNHDFGNGNGFNVLSVETIHSNQKLDQPVRGIIHVFHDDIDFVPYALFSVKDGVFTVTHLVLNSSEALDKVSEMDQDDILPHVVFQDHHRHFNVLNFVVGHVSDIVDSEESTIGELH